MSYTIYKQLGLGVPKCTTMGLFMADRSIKHYVGNFYDILVKVDRFIFNFVFLDCDIDAEVPIILGRPFLATGRALVDVEIGELMFWVKDEEVTFNAYKSMKRPSDIHVVSKIDVIKEAIANVSEMMCMGEPLASVLSNYDEEEIQEYGEVVVALSGLGAHSINPLKLDIDVKSRESLPAKPSTEEPPKLELKVFPSNLQYVFLG